MITLIRINETTYKVVIQRDDLTEEDFTKLIRKRDHFPSEFVNMVIDLIPQSKQFDRYDHYSMTLYVKN